jgi:CDP-diacylglycerol--glycerol-3-phosphate 3-phosphatidyltransferase
MGESLMRHVPNIITVSRMFLSVILLFTAHYPAVFILLYLTCGFSDVADGYIARRFHFKSDLGAKLDSAADMLMYGMILFVFLILDREKDLSKYYPLIALILLIRCINLTNAAYKYHSFVMLHTWGNKLTGILVFLTPIIMIIRDNSIIIYSILFLATVTAIEEGIIHIVSKQPNLNRRGLFWK